MDIEFSQIHEMVYMHDIVTVSYTHSDAADEEDSVDLGGRRIIKKKKKKNQKISDN